jgi:hypothetical protein
MRTLAAAIMLVAFLAGCSGTGDSRATNNDQPAKVTGTVTCNMGKHKPPSHPANVEMQRSFKGQPDPANVTYDPATGTFSGEVINLVHPGYRIVITGCGAPPNTPIGTSYTGHTTQVDLECRLTRSIFAQRSFDCTVVG